MNDLLNALDEAIVDWSRTSASDPRAIHTVIGSFMLAVKHIIIELQGRAAEADPDGERPATEREVALLDVRLAKIEELLAGIAAEAENENPPKENPPKEPAKKDPKPAKPAKPQAASAR